MFQIIKLICIILVLTWAGSFIVFRETERYSASDFVGRWESPKQASSIYFYPNGEWEELGNDGAVLQYGIWQYKKNMLIWSHKVGLKIDQVASPVLSVTPQEFRVMDSESTSVTFRRLKQ